ncbi:MAG: HprK-related kinase A [Planctomycetes bacterium]|nr:HprK-related kinase A [Planctomycetota bacterium]
MTTATSCQLDSPSLRFGASAISPMHIDGQRVSTEWVQLRIGVVNARIESSVSGLAEEYSALYSGYPTLHDNSHVCVRVERGRSRYTMGRRFIVSSNGERMFSVKRIEELLPHVEWALNWEVVRRLDTYLQLHAGVMERNGAGIVFPAAPGSGKTTLCAGLLSRGWRFLSDEFALIDTDGMVQPYPKALCIKEGSFTVMEHLGLPMISPRRYRKGQKGRVAYVNPLAMGVDAIGKACRLRHVVFPMFENGAKPALSSMSRGETGFALSRLSFNLRQKGARGMDILTRTLRGATCHRLVSGNIDATCDLLEELLGKQNHA